MKRGTWFRGDQKDGNRKNLSKTDRRVKKKGFQKAGKVGKTSGAATTVVFVPSTRGSTLIKSLKDEETKMAEMTGFRIKYQEAGGNVLVNSFDKDLGKGQHCAHPVTLLIRGRIVGVRTSCMSQHAARGKILAIHPTRIPAQGKAFILEKLLPLCMNVR